MKPPVTLGAVVLAAAAAVVGWRAWSPPPAAVLRASPRAAASPAPLPTPSGLPRVTRDLLRYVEPPSPAPLAPPPSAPPPVPSAPTALAAPGPQLLGFVRQRGALRAALLLPGEASVVTLAQGESEAGHTLLSVDEELGALLRLPDGSELRLRPAS